MEACRQEIRLSNRLVLSNKESRNLAKKLHAHVRRRIIDSMHLLAHVRTKIIGNNQLKRIDYFL